jgi:hypothetical protein
MEIILQHHKTRFYLHITVILLLSGFGSISAGNIDGLSGTYEVNNADMSLSGTFELGFFGRHHFFADSRPNQLAISLSFGMSPYVELGGYLSNAFDLWDNFNGKSQTATLSVKFRLLSESRYMPALAISSFTWKKLDGSQNSHRNLDVGYRVLLTKSLGTLKFHLNVGHVFWNHKFTINEAHLLFGTCVEYRKNNKFSLFTEFVGSTGHQYDTRMLIDRFNFGVKIHIWKNFQFFVINSFSKEFDSDNNLLNIGLSLGNTIVIKEVPEIEYVVPKLTDFSSFKSLEDIMKITQKDSSQIDSTIAEIEDEPERLMTIPQDFADVEIYKSDTSIDHSMSMSFELINACGQDHMARRLRKKLMDEGHTVNRIANYSDFGKQVTIIEFRPGCFMKAEYIANLLNLSDSQIIENTKLANRVDLSLLIGCDMLGFIEELGYKVIKTQDGFEVIVSEDN